MATLECPNCETTLKIPPSFTGKAARCPKCRTVVKIEQEEEVAECEIVEEDSSPSRRVQRDRPSERPSGQRRARLQQDDDEPEEPRPRRRPALRDEEEEEEREPAPRRQKRPRRRRPVEESEGTSWASIIGVGL